MVAFGCSQTNKKKRGNTYQEQKVILFERVWVELQKSFDDILGIPGYERRRGQERPNRW